MFLTSGNITLRALEPEDRHLLYVWENDPALWQVTERWTPVSLFEIEQFILNNQDINTQRQIRLMVELRDENKVQTTIGTIDIYEVDFVHSRAGIGVFIVSEHRRQGYAKTAIQLTENYCFETLRLHQLYGLIQSDNHGSLRLFEELGYRTTGRRTDWYKTADGYTDQISVQKNRIEYQKPKPA